MINLDRMDKIFNRQILPSLFVSGEEKETKYSYASKQPEGTPAKIAADKLKGDEALGAKILKIALEGPMRQIVANAGLESSVIVNEVKGKKGNFGFDAREEKYVDMIKAGIIDPTLVTRTAVQNAASIAGLLLTTEAVITDKPEPVSSASGPPMPDMGGMGGMGGMM